MIFEFGDDEKNERKLAELEDKYFYLQHEVRSRSIGHLLTEGVRGVLHLPFNLVSVLRIFLKLDSNDLQKRQDSI